MRRARLDPRAIIILLLALATPFTPRLQSQAASDFNSLRAAILAANSEGSGTIALDADIKLTADLPAITGAVTVDGRGHSISGDKQFRIFDVNGGALTLNSLTLTEGKASHGGAIRLRNGARLSLEDSTLRGNIAEKSGGAIYASGATVSISDSRFENNCSLFATFTLVSSGRDMDAHSVDSDGCLLVDYFRRDIDADLQAQVGGGAIRLLNGARAGIERSAFGDNTGSYGGAIATAGSRLTVRDSSFVGNRASERGGAIAGIGWAGGAISVRRSSFVKNSVERGGGGAINALDHKLDIANSTFSKNHAGSSGGALHINESAEVAITHVTFMLNRSSNGADAIGNAGGKAFLRNSIIVSSDGHEDCIGAWVESVGNLSLDGSCAERPSGAPLLGEMTGSPAYYPLRDRSPAVDYADPRFCPETDQLGTPRPQGGGCDIGAIEGRGLVAAEATPVPPVVCTLAFQIIAANRDEPAGGCPAGNGADTIAIEKDIILFELLPAITSYITIEGNGHSISADRKFRIFDVDGGHLTIKNLSMIDGNAGSSSGGAIRLQHNGRASIIDSSFIRNRAKSGGAIGVDSLGPYRSRLSVQGSRFVRNYAANFGGAMNLSGSSDTEIANSSFTQNKALAAGGAINAFSRARLEVTNSSFLDGSGAGWGGNSLAAEAGVDATLTHVTMYNRNPTGKGTELHIIRSSILAPSKVRLRNSIIAKTGSGRVRLCYGSLTQNIGNIIEGGACSPMLDSDPMLEEPNDNSSFITPLPGSPALGAADPRFCPDADQLGNPRAQAGRCDIGAIETAAITREIGECLVTTTHKLNFREAPGGDRIGSVPERASMPASARTPAWFKVDYRGRSGWISADYVKTDGECG